MHDSLTQHLPWWLGLATMPVLLSLGPLSYLAVRLAASDSVRRARALGDVHWTERARAVVTARSAAAVVMLYGGLFALALGVSLGGPLAHVGRGPLALLAVTIASIGGMLGMDAALRPLTRPLSVSHRWRARAFLIASQRPLVLGLIGMALLPGALPWTSFAGWSAVLVALSLTPIPGRLLNSLGWAKEAPPGLTELCQRMAEKRGVKLRGVGVLATRAVANAVAVPAPFRAVLVTEGLLEACDERELEAIVAHEVGHLTESAAVVTLRIAAGLMWLSLAWIPHLVHAHGAFPALGLLAGLLIARQGFLVASRRLEHRAAAHAVEHAAGAYAAALEALHRYNDMPAVLKQSTTHPNLYDRLVRAGHPPEYPRPEPPAPPPTSRAAFVLLGIAGALFAYHAVVRWQISACAEGGDLDAYVRLAALTGGSEDDLRLLADREPDARRRLPYEEIRCTTA